MRPAMTTATPFPSSRLPARTQGRRHLQHLLRPGPVLRTVGLPAHLALPAVEQHLGGAVGAHPRLDPGKPPASAGTAVPHSRPLPSQEEGILLGEPEGVQSQVKKGTCSCWQGSSGQDVGCPLRRSQPLTCGVARCLQGQTAVGAFSCAVGKLPGLSLAS